MAEPLKEKSKTIETKVKNQQAEIKKIWNSIKWAIDQLWLHNTILGIIILLIGLIGVVQIKHSMVIHTATTKVTEMGKISMTTQSEVGSVMEEIAYMKKQILILKERAAALQKQLKKQKVLLDQLTASLGTKKK